MEDPRYEDHNSLDELTDNSSDELKDLQKEYEIKLKQLLEKKRADKEYKKRQHEQQTRRQVLNSPQKKIEKPATKIPSSPIQGHNRSIPETTTNVQSKKPSNSWKADVVKNSNFISHLYDSYKGDREKIDFENRVFEFKDKPRRADIDVEEFDDLCHEHLRKRYLKEEALKSLLKHVRLLKVEKLLAKVSPPRYDDPDYENWAFLGFIVHKSDPKQGKDGKKFLKVSVGNFSQTVDVMFFGKAFEKNWKLKEGDLVAILNPQINKFTPPYKGFNLRICDDLDSILEIGSIKHFGYCSAMNLSNIKCNKPINTSKSLMCVYHLEMRYRKQQSSRMELSGSVQMKSPRRGQKKQSMYLNKDGKGGFIDFKTINEDSKVYTLDGIPIDRSKYHSPSILQNLQQKRRKLKDQACNKLLEKQLSLLSGNSTVRKLGLVKSTAPKESECVTRAFTPSTLNKLGFNPIAQASGQDKRHKKSQDLKELYELSLKSSKSLETSPEMHSSKIQKWKKNQKSFNEYKNKTQHKIPNDLKTKKLSTQEMHTLSAEADSSEDDLDISFEDETCRKEYIERTSLRPQHP
ncbi:uncharacterized protein PRCAT00000098001 [Priceomyces carsonii]|uniref:uncharacterized protein n=1 Tax=Priceomyces carsonii TaxID=28549 RepID=UPI002EDA4B46|nr:unnamed protein product [Priceomyces carsonii]